MMMNNLKIIIIVLILLIIMADGIAGDLYPFYSEKKQRQYNELIEQLRCLVCQNESLADSNAPLAADLRKQVYMMVQQKRSDQFIKNYLVARYGNFVLFKPPFNKYTYFLWFSPFALFMLGVFILYFVVRKYLVKPIKNNLSKRQKQMLEDILQQ